MDIFWWSCCRRNTDGVYQHSSALKFLAAVGSVTAVLIAVFLSPPAVASDDIFDMAAQHFEGKNYVRAVMLYEKALQMATPSADRLAQAYFYLGQSYHYLKRSDDALACFKTVSDSYPKHFYTDSARKWMGDCYVLKNEYDTAISIFKNILSNHTDTNIAALAKFELARALFMKADYPSSLVEFTDFVERHPESPLARTARFYILRIQRIGG